MFPTVITKDERIRKLPYPFLAALSVSSDVEYFSFPVFEEVMKFLNSTKETRLGRGLGIEMTSSVFFYSVPGDTFAYFDDAGPRPRPGNYSARIDEYLKGGWIDTNHSFGDFDATCLFRRHHAERAYEVLESLGIALPLYTDHGGYHNFQSVGAGSPDYHFGDVPGSPHYHSDLMGPHGVRYVWSDSGMVMEAYGGTEPSAPVEKRPRKLFGSLLKRQEPVQAPEASPVSVLAPCYLQDGSLFQSFTRFRSTGQNAPNLSSLLYQIRKIDWEDVFANAGVVIIYQHLGILHRAGGTCYPATLDQIKARPEVFLSPFYLLKGEFDQGRLWLAGLSRLLSYADCLQGVELNYDESDKTYRIAFREEVNSPEDFFQGLTIYTDTPDRVRLLHGEREIPVVYNGPDETHRYSFSVPLRKLPDIW